MARPQALGFCGATHCRPRPIIDRLAAPLESAIALLCTIPGEDRNIAITILSEIGTDMSQY
jgi:hypothetical protein